MLEKEVLELVVKKVMDKFARENNGSKDGQKKIFKMKSLTLEAQ